jgi:phosphate starvation-inducible PhoH-like protein
LVDAVSANTLVFAIGPAGTGKTFLAVVMALAALRAGRVQRIILSRPAVEAGEKLGFLPGDLQEKVDPYLRPLFDALGELLEPQAVTRAVERGQIEVAPLAYMRGRTLADSFIVLDEAQNTTNEQMKMFLTRIGAGSRMLVCGDVTQIDLPHAIESGLVAAARLFEGVADTAVVQLGDADVVRHPLIRRIIDAYQRGRR